MLQSLISLIILLTNTHGMVDIDYSSYDYEECENCITYIQWFEASGKYYITYVTHRNINSSVELSSL